MLSNHVRKLASKHFRGLKTPLGQHFDVLLQRSEFSAMLNFKVDPRDYTCPDAYFRDASAVAFFKKCPGLVPRLTLHEKAIAAFFECERQNRFTNNVRLQWTHRDESLRYVCDQAQLVIHRILGPLPSRLSPKFGPGATFLEKGKFLSIMRKIENAPSHTPAAVDLLPVLYETAWGGSLLSRGVNSAPVEVEGNRFTSVPKDSTKNRGICIEPSFNVFAQLGVGAHIRRRLFSGAGIDLDNGQNTHRDLARMASQDGGMATLDLSNASDTLSYGLIKRLLGETSSWFQLLDTLRSPVTFIGGSWVTLEKFSSMGNGYTFELETLVFYALAEVITNLHPGSKRPWVYGDDIIIDRRAAPALMETLERLGLVLNREKSFWEGSFRESCGGDFFRGQAVRPYHCKDENPSCPADWFALANGYRARYYDEASDTWLAGPTPWLYAIEQIPRHLRLFGPEYLGDSVIHHHDRSRWVTRPSKWLGGAPSIDVKRLVPYGPKDRLEYYPSEVALAAALYGVPSTGTGYRDTITGYRTRWSPFN